MAPRTWTCQRSSGGTKCGATNFKRFQKCQTCGKKRPATKKKDHERALELTYEDYVLINGGDHCGICGYERKPGERKLDRDHAHVGPIAGRPRGLLCHGCNRTLSFRMEISARGQLVEWLRRAADYVERAEQRSGWVALESFLETSPQKN